MYLLELHNLLYRASLKQLEELMLACESVKEELREVKEAHREEVKILKDEITELRAENKKLREDNERMKRNLNNNSSNSSLPSSNDQKGKGVNTCNSREARGKKQGGQLGHTGKTLTKEEVKEKIKSGLYSHKVMDIGVANGEYTSKYVIDLENTPSGHRISLLSK